MGHRKKVVEETSEKKERKRPSALITTSSPQFVVESDPDNRLIDVWPLLYQITFVDRDNNDNDGDNAG